MLMPMWLALAVLMLGVCAWRFVVGGNMFWTSSGE